MLDETMSYTCAVFGPGDSLADAQRNKLALICAKLGLRRGETLLDIGCGFGGLAAFAAERHGARVVGVTNSREHARVARERCARWPGVEILELDYRELPRLGRRFDRIASIEMIEAVGPKNYATYMGVVDDCLAPGGRFLVQSFVSDESQHVCNEWFDRYVFPNGVSPSLAQLEAATRGRFGAPVVDELGAHYPPTLLAWDRNLRAFWPAATRRRDRREQRLWHFYLTCLAGVFRAGYLRLCQLGYARAGAAAEVERSEERAA
jgi:cyclopropane-fatty-acyl-phospholipid synthase